jgi:hypothetical protein
MLSLLIDGSLSGVAVLTSGVHLPIGRAVAQVM